MSCDLVRPQIIYLEHYFQNAAQFLRAEHFVDRLLHRFQRLFQILVLVIELQLEHESVEAGVVPWDFHHLRQWIRFITQIHTRSRVT